MTDHIKCCWWTMKMDGGPTLMATVDLDKNIGYFIILT